MDPFFRPEFLLLLLEQGDKSLEDHTGPFLMLANATCYPDGTLCSFYNASLNTTCRALSSEDGPRGDFAAYVEWTLARNGSPLTVCPEDDLARSTPDPEPSPPSSCGAEHQPEPTDDGEPFPTAICEPAQSRATERKIAPEVEPNPSDQVREPATVPTTREPAVDGVSVEWSSASCTAAEGELIVHLGLLDMEGDLIDWSTELEIELLPLLSPSSLLVPSSPPSSPLVLASSAPPECPPVPAPRMCPPVPAPPKCPPVPAPRKFPPSHPLCLLHRCRLQPLLLALSPPSYGASPTGLPSSSVAGVGVPSPPPPAAEARTPPRSIDPVAPPRLLAPWPPPSPIDPPAPPAPSSLRLRLGRASTRHCLWTPLLWLRSSLRPTGSVGLLPPASSTLVLSCSGSAADLRISASASVARALGSPWPPGSSAVPLARWLSVSTSGLLHHCSAAVVGPRESGPYLLHGPSPPSAPPWEIIMAEAWVRLCAYCSGSLLSLMDPPFIDASLGSVSGHSRGVQSSSWAASKFPTAPPLLMVLPVRGRTLTGRGAEL